VATRNNNSGTYTGNYNYQIFFYNKAYQSVTFTKSAYVYVPDTAAVEAGRGTTITNDGTLLGNGGEGIFVGVYGVVINNQSDGRIVGPSYGIVVSGYPAEITNAGYISGIQMQFGGTITNTGVIHGNIVAHAFGTATLFNSGTVIAAGNVLGAIFGTNQPNGLIEGTGGGGAAAGTTNYAFTNNGTILATGTAGIAFEADGGTAFNQGTGLIEATGPLGIGLEVAFSTSFTNAGPVLSTGSGGSGAYLTQGTTLVNTSTITGSGNSGAGVRLKVAASVTNAATGRITGFNGIYDNGSQGVTVVNQGTISVTGGASAYAVRFGSGNDLLELDPAGSAAGRLNGGLGVSTLELLAGTSSAVGSLQGLGSSITNFRQIQIDSQAQWALAGANTVAAAVSVLVAGILTSTDTLTNNGEIDASTGTLAIGGPLHGNGTIALSNNAFVDLLSSGQAGGALAFRDATGTLSLGDPLGVALTIQNFAAGDVLDLPNTTYATGPVTANYADGHLMVTQGGNMVASLAASGIVAGAHFAAHADSHGGTDLTVAPCFSRGTRIQTARGEVPVERLSIGDEVALHDGGFAPVRWLGHRHVDCRAHGRPEQVWPVRVQAGAFAPAAPARDLFLSPDHAVYIDGVLIPIRYLINGATVAQSATDTVEYWHVELARHAVILAEGLPAESYLDTGNRDSFVGATREPDAAASLRIWATQACARLVRDGAELEAARSVLLEHAVALGHAVTGDPALHAICNGRRVLPSVAGRRYRFRLPPGGRSVRLVSRRAVPAQLGCDSDDHRELGVAISSLLLDGRDIDLGSPMLSSGWHAVEQCWRWTNGDAGLALAGVRILQVEIAMTERYWLDDDLTTLTSVA
jgi:hypothetical protein